MEKRLQTQYQTQIKSHMKAATRSNPGPHCPVDVEKTTSASQNLWRFLKNDRVSLEKLIEPLRKLGRDGCRNSQSKFVLVAHDWCKLDYKSHANRKSDLLQLTHKTDIGYDLTTALLVEADTGITLAPMQIHLKTSEALHSTAKEPPRWEGHHLDQLETTMAEASNDWDLPRTPVHVIDREADSLGRLRRWHSLGHLFLVRCDDRRVRCEGRSVLLSELDEELDQTFQYVDAGKALHEGKKVQRQVGERTVTLYRPHSAVIDGEKKSIAGKPIELRAVFVRLVDDDGWIVAQWTLLTNVPGDEADASEVGKWYYFRWRIESFFKLLKSHGLELEYWQQETGLAIAKRLLLAAMACVLVKQLEASESEAAIKFRRHLIRLSGRRMKRGVEFTGPALLAGYYVHLNMLDYLMATELSLEEMKDMENAALSEIIDV